MSESKENLSSGILNGLKKVLFHSDDAREDLQAATPTTAEPLDIPAQKISVTESNWSEDDSFKDMKLRVYQLLENLNKPGVDFFEVWNAAVEMGGANSNNIKSAFTSLKYADKSLSKARLLETGTSYVNGLTNVIETESKKRLEEKNRLNKEMEDSKASLDTEVSSIEKQIVSLQQRLSDKKSERENIHAKYEPKIAEIDLKINAGRRSVNSVMSEMQEVIEIIKKDLN